MLLDNFSHGETETSYVKYSDNAMIRFVLWIVHEWILSVEVVAQYETAEI